MEADAIVSAPLSVTNQDMGKAFDRGRKHDYEDDREDEKVKVHKSKTAKYCRYGTCG